MALSILSGPGVAGIDVSDPGFDIDAAIDASAAADPSIAGTAGIVKEKLQMECFPRSKC